MSAAQQAAEAHWRDRGVELRTWIAVRRIDGASWDDLTEEMAAALDWTVSRETMRRWATRAGLDAPAAAKVHLAQQGYDLPTARYAVDRVCAGDPVDANPRPYRSSVTPAEDEPDEADQGYGEGVTPPVLGYGRTGTSPEDNLAAARERIGGRP